MLDTDILPRQIGRHNYLAGSPPSRAVPGTGCNAKAQPQPWRPAAAHRNAIQMLRVGLRRQKKSESDSRTSAALAGRRHKSARIMNPTPVTRETGKIRPFLLLRNTTATADQEGIRYAATGHSSPPIQPVSAGAKLAWNNPRNLGPAHT